MEMFSYMAAEGVGELSSGAFITKGRKSVSCPREYINRTNRRICKGENRNIMKRMETTIVILFSVRKKGILL